MQLRSVWGCLLGAALLVGCHERDPAPADVFVDPDAFADAGFRDAKSDVSTMDIIDIQDASSPSDTSLDTSADEGTDAVADAGLAVDVLQDVMDVVIAE